jgi:hypothetical protein
MSENKNKIVETNRLKPNMVNVFVYEWKTKHESALLFHFSLFRRK